MELNENEKVRLAKLEKWSKSKIRRSLLYAFAIFLGLLFIYFISIFVFGCIDWKEFGWIIFFFMAIIIWYKAVYDLESYVIFLVKAIEKLESKKARKIYEPSSNEIELAPKAFQYEFVMFGFACVLPKILAGNSEIPKDGVQNITIELALLHARNIFDFFCGEPWRDNIHVSHFVPQNAKWRSTKLQYLRERKQDINKALSHLTYTRILKKPTWDIYRIRDEIVAAYNEFLAILPLEERDKWIPKQ